jgi:hypothetical protein
VEAAPNADGAREAGQKVRAQSIFLCIALDILYHGENGENAALFAGILMGNWPVVKLCKGRAGCR